MDELLQTAPCGFFSFDDDGKLLEANDTLIRMLETKREHVVGHHIDRILSAGSRIFYQTHLFPFLKNRGFVEEMYLSLRTDRGPRKVLVNGVRRERDGKVANECIAVSMLRRETYEHELLIAKKAAEAANEAKAKFLAMMSHELRTPLQVIFGFTDVLLYGLHGELGEEQLADLASIRDASHQLARTIGNILSFSQLESGWIEVRTEKVSLNQALLRAERALRYRLGATEVNYRRVPLEPDVDLLVDPERLHQILMNLILNAADASQPGGRVSVVCERVDDRAVITVRDSGVSIAEDETEEIFHPFNTSKRVSETKDESALGLSISREIARAMSGNLEVENEGERGAVFKVTLPLAISG